MFRLFADLYGWLPHQVARMTIPQVMMLLDDGGKKNTVKMSPEELRRWRAR